MVHYLLNHLTLRWLRCLVAAASVTLVVTPLAYAQKTEERDELQKSYVHYRQNNPSPFGTTPVTHITPSRNTFTFGLSTDYYDSLVVPDDQNARESKNALNQFTVTGWTAAPIIAYSGKHYGVAFTIETGERESFFVKDFRPSGGNYQAQHGAMEYYGGGAYFYALVPSQFLPSVVQLTLMAGGTRIRATHKTNGGVTSDIDGSYRTYRYPVHRNQAGAILDLRLRRRFSLVFWYNYMTHKTFTPDVIAADAGADQAHWGDDNWDLQLAEDQEVFWQVQPRHRMGLDIAYRPGKFEIHLGGLLGYVANRGTTPRNILDNNIFLGFAFSRGNK